MGGIRKQTAEELGRSQQPLHKPYPFPSFPCCVFRRDYGNRLAGNTVPTAPCKSLGRAGSEGSALVTGVAITNRSLFLLPIQHS